MRSFASTFALTASLLVALVAACSSSKGTTSSSGATSTGNFGGAGGGDAGSDAPNGVTLRIDPMSSNVTVTLGTTPPMLTFHAYASMGGGPEEDVTSQAEWSMDPTVGGIGSGVVMLTGNGGKTNVTATYQGVTATAPLTVLLTGDVFGMGTDMTTKASFASATPDPSTMAAPSIQYPEDGVILPGNLPPIEAQWAQGAADNATFRVHLTSPGILDVSFYTTAEELLFPTMNWATIAATTADAPTQIEVDALGSGDALRSSVSRTMTIASDTIDNSAIYVWQSSTGSFRVLDIVAGKDVLLPTSEPALQPGQPCSGCHRISRDGTRFSYSYNGGNFEFGALKYDAKQMMFTSTIAPSTAFRGTYATFNPNESTQAPAMVMTVPDVVPQNTAGNVQLQLVDPDTGKPIASNLAAMLGKVDAGNSSLMPDWSPDGSFVVFAAYDSTMNYVRDLGDDVVAASIVEMPVSWDATNGFTFGMPKTLVKVPAGAASMPDTGENNFLPAISPDGAAVAFTRSSGWWSIKTQTSNLNLSGQIVLVRRSDGQVLQLVKGSNGPGTTMNSTWPQWAPSIGKRYMWLAYAAERPYGHRLTATSPENAMCGFVQGQKLCKHLWVTAIDLTKLASGTDDPSASPFWIPGQTIAAQYVSPQWTKAVLPGAQ